MGDNDPVSDLLQGTASMLLVEDVLWQVLNCGEEHLDQILQTDSVKKIPQVVVETSLTG
jgi:hypothetical protein